MATSVQVLSKRKPYLKPHVQLEPRGFLEGYFEGVPHGVPRLQELGPYLGLYFDFLEDSYKLRCISAGWGSDQNTAMFSSQANKIHTHASC